MRNCLVEWILWKFLFYTDLYFLIFGNVMWQNVVEYYCTTEE